MATSTYTTDPLPFPSPGQDQIIEILRGFADPRLVVIVEGDSDTEVYQRVQDLNDELRPYGSFRIPLPDRCPTCGHRSS